MNSLSNKKDNVELLDLPDELILTVVKMGDFQISFLCSIIDVGNRRLEQLTFDQCRRIDLVVDYIEAKESSLLRKRLYSDIMPRIYDQIQSLTINIHHVASIQKFLERNYNGILPNLIHLRIRLCVKHSKSGIRYRLGSRRMCFLELWEQPLFTIVAHCFFLPEFSIGEHLTKLCRSSVVRSVRSLEVDDCCSLINSFRKGERYFTDVPRLTHIRLSLLDFYQCVNLLLELGPQLHSLVITLGRCVSFNSDLRSDLEAISCPKLKQVKMTIYENFDEYETCFSLLRCLSSVEYLTLLLAIGKNGVEPNHFIDELVLEKSMLRYMYHLRQFKFHIRSILKYASHHMMNEIHESFLRQQPFNCVYDYFKNNYGQCQIYSIPFVGTRLDFISNRFPLFDGTFSSVTTLLIFDDVLPFENSFFQRLAQALPRLKTLEIRNELGQQQKAMAANMNTDRIHFPHLTVLILYVIHMDYAEQFLCQIHHSSLVELAINKEILLAIIEQNHPQARDNCSRIGSLLTSKPSYEIIDKIEEFFPVAEYFKHIKE
ncbi:unnamed protein product [Adineta ricciae]|uniref:F-box domain-containing protein n=1 Tax=Adineta ricciae TaxID=249248 RepID=A0A815L9E9_ADIRI|nr:unnamed protein product [Adineta ricciae]CAF1472683.1 unnamed protein product [Adineta ricciae]